VTFYVEIWKNLTGEMKNELFKNLQETIPIVTIPIYKKGDKNKPSNYRPISLLNTTTKPYTCILAAHIDYWVLFNNKLSE